MIAVAGGIAVFMGALLLYLASEHQQLWPGHGAHRGLAITGAVGMLLGLIMITQWSGPATSVFITMTLAILVWTVLPLAVAWLRGVPEDRK